MDLDLTDDQELLRETTERFIESSCPLPQVRALADTDAGVDTDYLRQGAELGWFSLLVPEEHGGGSVSGNGVLDAVVLAEERGRFLQPGPFVVTNVVAAALAAHGTTDQQAKVLPVLLAGEEVASWALADPTGDWTGAAGVAAAPAGGGWTLSGSKGLVQDAHLASWLLVTAPTGAGLSQFLVAADAPGVAVKRLAGLDLSRRLCEVIFDGVAVSTGDLVGAEGGAADAVERQLQLAVVLTIAESIGAMDELFRLALDYAKARTAFGRPIGSFQAIKHLLADTSLLLEQSKAIAVAAAHAVQDERPEAAEVASMAKAFVGDAGIELSQSCWQIFGGIGYTWEHDNHLYVRRLAADAALYGQPWWHRERICTIHGL